MHARIHKIGTSHHRGQPRARRTGALARNPRRGLARWWLLLGSQPERPTPKPRGPLARDDRLARVEAVLFLAREPLTSRKIGQLAGLTDGTAARTAVRQLNRLYDQGGSPFRAEELAGGFQLLTRPPFGPWLRRLLHTPVETRLSAPALETLAVVAYRQPVLRADIEAIRGVQCGDILRQLMDRDLVRITSRADDLGRPLLYGTTKRFLQIFGLRHLDELPQAAALRRRELPAESSENPDLPSAEGVESPPTPLQTSENRAI
jgi:segregation and condensation protein B